MRPWYLVLAPLCLTLLIVGFVVLNTAVRDPLAVGTEQAIQLGKHQLRFRVVVEFVTTSAPNPTRSPADSIAAGVDTLSRVPR